MERQRTPDKPKPKQPIEHYYKRKKQSGLLCSCGNNVLIAISPLGRKYVYCWKCGEMKLL